MNISLKTTLEGYTQNMIALLEKEGVNLPHDYSLSIVDDDTDLIFEMKLTSTFATTLEANTKKGAIWTILSTDYKHLNVTFHGEPIDGILRVDFTDQFDEDEKKGTLPVHSDGTRFSPAEIYKPQPPKKPRNIVMREVLPLTQEMLDAEIKGTPLRGILAMCEIVALSENGAFNVYLAPPEVLKKYFSQFDENREIIESHIESLEDSYETHGYLYTEAFVNERLQEIDAQHRIETAIRNNLSIHFRIMVGWGMDEVTVYNVNNKNWTALDFLISYAKKGISAYVIFKKFFDKHPFDLSSCEVLFKGNRIKRGKKASENIFNNKQLQITEAELVEAEKRAVVMNDFAKYHPSGWKTRNFAEAIYFMTTSPKYNHQTMMKKIAKLKETDNVLLSVKGVLRVQEYVQFLVKTFNKNTSDEDIIPIPPRYMD